MTMTPLDKARQAMIEKRAAGELQYLNPIQKAARNPESLRKAVNGKCWECVGGVNAIREISRCTAWGCPLWPVRPYRNNAPDSYGKTERAAVVARLEAAIPEPGAPTPGDASLALPFEDI